MTERWYNWRVQLTVLFVIIIFVINNGAQYLLYSNQQVIADALGRSIADIRLMISASLFVSAGTLVFWGYFGDKFSKKYVLIVSSVVWILAAFYIFFTKNFEELFLGQILFGLGFGAVWPICYSLLGDIVKPESRGKVFSVVTLTTGVGLVIGLFLGSAFQSDWRFPFMIVALLGTANIIVFLFVGTDLKRGGAEHELKNALAQGAIYKYEIRREHLKIVWKKRTNLNLFLQGIPGCIPWAVLLIVVPIYFQNLGYEATTANLIAVLSQASTVVGSLFAGWCGDRLALKSQRNRLLFVGLSILIPVPFFIGAFLLPYPLVGPDAGFAVFWTTPLYPIGFLLITIASFFSSNAGVNWYSIVEAVNEPEVRATIIGFHAVTDRIGTAIGPGLAGVLYIAMGAAFGPQWSEPGSIIVACLFWIPCALLWLWNMRYIDKDVSSMKSLLAERAKDMEEGLTKSAPLESK
jgi:MFS family permease